MYGRRRKKKKMGKQVANRYEKNRRLGEKEAEGGRKGNWRRMRLVKKEEEEGLNKIEE